VLEDLRRRLGETRWPEPIPGAEWDYGANVETIRELCEYWRDGYDWRAHEAELNRFPGFRCEVDGVDLHFWHLRSAKPDALPLLLLHGWPGSIYEFHQVIGPLSEQFDLVVPALPGFGFSGKPRERGWGVTRIAAAFDTLMSMLGYERYGVQGGDWGAIIAAKLGAAYPEHVAGIHVNYVIAPPPPDAGPEHAAAVEHYRHWRTYEDAYSRLQRTKPDSLTVGQSDSPAGLAAWIVEKFRTWSDCDGDVVGYFGRDTLLTNLMFYWAPPAHGSVESAARIYYESARDPAGREERGRVEVPVAYAEFPHEIMSPPREWAEAHYAIERWTEMPRGGHFAALEAPEQLAGDVRAFFG
jgi:epoxide hydrolase